jgi:hypothetical protein
MLTEHVLPRIRVFENSSSDGRTGFGAKLKSSGHSRICCCCSAIYVAWLKAAPEASGYMLHNLYYSPAASYSYRATKQLVLLNVFSKQSSIVVQEVSGLRTKGRDESHRFNSGALTVTCILSPIRMRCVCSLTVT